MGENFIDLLDVSGLRNREFVKIAGLVTEIKRIRTKKGESMAFVSVQDETGIISCTIFPKQYISSNIHLVEMGMIIIEGTVEWRQRKTTNSCTRDI